MRVRLLALIGLLSLMAVGLPAAAQGSTWYYNYVISPPSGSPAGGWVQVTLFLAPGCSGCTCGSNWTPGSSQGLFENPGDRMTVGRGSGGDPAPVWSGRQICPAGTVGAGLPVAGTWYHNARFDVVYGSETCTLDYATHTVNCTVPSSWGGMIADGWVFAPSDDCCDGGGCGGGGGGGGGGGVGGRDCGCPGESWAYATPAAGPLRWEPEYPVVVGQDPSRHGVYAIADVWVDPAKRTYYALNPNLVDGNGCFICEQRTESVRDTLKAVDMRLQLTPASQDWITHDLARRYPGAKVYAPDLSAPATLYGCHYAGDMHVCVARAQVLTRDPGYWTAEATLTTQFTGAHAWEFRERVPVYLKDSTLIK